MSRARTAPSLRLTLPPLGGILALGLAAGVLISRPAADQTWTAPPAAAAADQPVAGLVRTTAAVVHRSSQYAFLLMQPDKVTPIRWNPCRPVHYKVEVDRLVPRSEIAQVRAAFDAAGRALGGVSLVYGGQTTVIPQTVDDSARAHTDLVFAFALAGRGAGRSPLLSGWEAGRGGFAASGAAGSTGVVVEKPTRGSVVIDASKWAVMTRHDRTLLYLHEVGHAMGLDHPKATDQVMSPGAYDLPPRYQKGDLAGLALLGRKAGCSP